MVKGHHAYKDSWATNLGKEIPCQRDASSWFNVSQSSWHVKNREVWHAVSGLMQY